MEGHPNGKGTLTYSDGTVVEGTFAKGLRDGHCVTKNPEKGFEVSGHYTNDVLNGYVEILDQSGESYKGEWHNGKMNGKGVYTEANGDTYDGEFSDGKRHG